MASGAARILIAEDDESLRHLLVRYLTSLGYTVDAFADGAAAGEALGRTRFAVVLTDVIMPGVGGLEVLRAAKEADRQTEVIFLTGAPDLSTTVKALREGDAFDYIVKPFPNVEILRATVERAIERGRLRQEIEGLQRGLGRQSTTAAPAGGPREQRRTEDLLGRYWADKFVCLLPETALLDAHTVAERIRWTLASADLDLEGAVVPVRISAGVSMRKDADGSLDTMVRRAERALARSKDDGGNRGTLAQEPAGRSR